MVQHILGYIAKWRPFQYDSWKIDKQSKVTWLDSWNQNVLITESYMFYYLLHFLDSMPSYTQEGTNGWCVLFRLQFVWEPVLATLFTWNDSTNIYSWGLNLKEWYQCILHGNTNESIRMQNFKFQNRVVLTLQHYIILLSKLCPHIITNGVWPHIDPHKALTVL